MMRTLLSAFVASALLAAPTGAATSDDPLMAPVHQFIDGFNKGDTKAVNASFVTTGLAIIDDVPPHVWTGTNALQAWIKDLSATDKKEGNTDQSVTVGNPTREISNGARGYLILPVVYHYKQRGTAMHEPAQMAFALQMVAGKWLITGWTWVGTKPQPGK
jgi:hypothetical protein